MAVFRPNGCGHTFHPNYFSKHHLMVRLGLLFTFLVMTSETYQYGFIRFHSVTRLLLWMPLLLNKLDLPNGGLWLLRGDKNILVIHPF